MTAPPSTGTSADAVRAIATTRRRVAGITAAAGAGALAFGALLPVAPLTAVGMLVAVPLAFLAPLAAFSVLVAVTVLVPFEVQDTFAVVGGRDQPGLLLVDVLLILGLGRVAWLVARGRLALDAPLLAACALLLVVTAGFAWGVASGAPVSEAGHEARRVVLGVGAFVLAWPLVHDPVARRRMGPMLLAVAAALGVWGLAQWVFAVDFTNTADVGVRPRVDLTSAGRGQLQGGLFAYPVAVTLTWAALVSGLASTTGRRVLYAAVVVLNLCCVLLTYERTFWVVTVLACILVALASGAAARKRAVQWAALLVVLLGGGVAALAPGELRTAAERLLSVSRVHSDNSFSYRVIESQEAVDAIVERPLTGSGFGAMITWGADDLFATITTPFVHNGYLWLAWKLGIPAAAGIVMAIAWAIVRRGPDVEDGRWRALRTGSRAALLALLLANITFPTFDVLGITAVMGLLTAICCSRVAERPL
jgi:hypothetical protein